MCAHYFCTATFVLHRLPDTSATRHVGTQDTLGHFSTGLRTLRHQNCGTRHFDTSAVVEEKPGHFDPGHSDETQLHRWFGINFGTTKLVPKCLGAKVSCGRSVRLSLHHSDSIECDWRGHLMNTVIISMCVGVIMRNSTVSMQDIQHCMSLLSKCSLLQVPVLFNWPWTLTPDPKIWSVHPSQNASLL